MPDPVRFRQRFVTLVLFALVLSVPYAIPVPWIAVLRWFGGNAENAGFLPSPVENQSWYIILGACITFILIMLFKPAGFKKPETVTVVAILWFMITLLRAAFTPEIQWSYLDVFLQIAFLFIFLMGWLSRVSITQLSGFSIFAVALSIPLSILALFQYAGHDPLPYSDIIPGTLDLVQGKQLITSTFGHPNYMGSYLAPIIVLSAGIFTVRVSYPVKIIAGIAALLAVLALISGGTRGSIVATLGALAVFSALLPGRGIRRFGPLVLAITGIAGIGAVLAIVPRINPNFQLLERLTASKEITSRAFYWHHGLQSFYQNPVWGIGPGQFDRLFWVNILNMPETRAGEAWHFVLTSVIRGVRPGEMHNDHLQVLVETGLIGAGAWVLLWSGIVARLIKIRQSSQRNRVAINAACGGALAAVFLDGIFGFPYRLPCSGALFWCLLGLWAGLNLRTQRTIVPQSE